MKLSLIACSAALIATQSFAEPVCGPEDAVSEALRNRYGETPVAHGVLENGMLMTTWANPDTGTWTITINDGGDVECMAASGSGFSSIAPEPNL